jgi:sugar lactone lactonase YvrE
VYHLNTDNLELAFEKFPEPVSCLALRRNGQGVGETLHGFFVLAHHQQLACAAAQGFALLEGNSKLKYISKPLPDEHVPHIRFNDGACDSKGRFFAGTLCSKEHNIAGKLYRYDPADGSCVVVDEGPFTVSGRSFAHKYNLFLGISRIATG